MRRRLTGLFLLTGVATACGRLASQQGDAGAFDGSPEIDASSDADAAYAAFYGTVSVEVQPQTNGRYGGWDAVFIPWNKPLPTAGVTSCDGVLLGGCCYSKITKGTTPTEPSGGLFPTPDGVSAGTVSILNQTEQLQPITREFDAGGYFPSPSDSWDLFWTPGDVLRTNATGDVVSAFTGDIVGPMAVAGLSPPIDSASLVIPLTTDWTMTWQPPKVDGGGSVGDERLTLTLASADDQQIVHEIVCDVPYADERLTVPAALLAMMPPTLDDAGYRPFSVVKNYALSRVYTDNAVVLLSAGVLTEGMPRFQ